jgi:hypothetical protein
MLQSNFPFSTCFVNNSILCYEVLCAAASRLAAERSEADKPAEAHKTIFAPNNIYYFFFKPS